MLTVIETEAPAAGAMAASGAMIATGITHKVTSGAGLVTGVGLATESAARTATVRVVIRVGLARARDMSRAGDTPTVAAKIVADSIAGAADPIAAEVALARRMAAAASSATTAVAGVDNSAANGHTRIGHTETGHTRTGRAGATIGRLVGSTVAANGARTAGIETTGDTGMTASTETTVHALRTDGAVTSARVQSGAGRPERRGGPLRTKDGRTTSKGEISAIAARGTRPLAGEERGTGACRNDAVTIAVSRATADRGAGMRLLTGGVTVTGAIRGRASATGSGGSGLRRRAKSYPVSSRHAKSGSWAKNAVTTGTGRSHQNFPRTSRRLTWTLMLVPNCCRSPARSPSPWPATLWRLGA